MSREWESRGMDWCTLSGVVVDKAGHVHVAFVRTDDGMESWVMDGGDSLGIEVRAPCRLIEEESLIDWLYQTADEMGDKLPTVVIALPLTDAPV